jgi:AraC-like DNA-binding protein
MRVTTREGLWIVPPQRALWIPLGMEHEIGMEGVVAVRMLYLDAAASAPFGPHCRVLAVSALLRELVLAAVQAHEHRRRERMLLLAPLLLHELQMADETALHIPVPSDPRLRKACQRLLAGTARAETLEQLAARAGASSRTLARLFESELQMSFVRWRQHVRLARALSQLSQGLPIKAVARDAGYASCSAFIAMFHRVLGRAHAGRPPRTSAIVQSYRRHGTCTRRMKDMAPPARLGGQTMKPVQRTGARAGRLRTADRRSTGRPGA